MGGAAPAHCPVTALSSPRLLPTVQEALHSQNSHAGEISCGHIMAQWVPRHGCACCCVVAAPLPAFAPRGSLKVLKEEAVDEDAAAALCWGPSQQTLLMKAPAAKLRGVRSCQTNRSGAAPGASTAALTGTEAGPSYSRITAQAVRKSKRRAPRYCYGCLL